MKEFKGTKGDWTVDNDIFYNDYNAKTISIDFQPEYQEHCVDVYMGISDNEEELRANANLIASAPDLLKALQETEKDLCVLWGQMLDLEKTNPKAEGLSNLIDGWRKRNKQAINKALN